MDSDFHGAIYRNVAYVAGNVLTLRNEEAKNPFGRLNDMDGFKKDHPMLY
jgi:hypothetical protein